MPIDNILEEQSEEFQFLYFHLVTLYYFFKEKEGSKVRSSSWKSFSFSSPNFFEGGEISDNMTREARAKNLGSKKTSIM